MAGIKLSPPSYPVWSVTISLPASTTLGYKYIKRDAAGNVVWESSTNRVLALPSSGEIALDDTFR